MISDKRIEVRQNIINLKSGIFRAIDKLCRESNWTLTYAEINSALVEVLKDNIDRDVVELWKEEEE